MQWFRTPKGEAGCDQLDAMEESIQAAIEQMFWQVAKRDSLCFGVGRAAARSSSSPDQELRLDAQKRECDGLIVFHAGKALETALQVVYARTNNRIPGREYPSVSASQMKRDRRSHNLASLHGEILRSVETKSDLRKRLEDEFESVYQTAYHQGIHDLIVDGEIVHQFAHVEDTPFREARIGGVRHGAEITLDHSSFRQAITALQEESDFSQMPCGNFREFLLKADVAYYRRRNMRWALYSARDHERGRPYVVVGTRFFARLVKGLVGMAGEQWIWDEKFATRWHERRRLIVHNVVDTHVRQSFVGNLDLPELTSANEMMELYRSEKSMRTDDYDSLHAKWELSVRQSSKGKNRK